MRAIGRRPDVTAGLIIACCGVGLITGSWVFLVAAAVLFGIFVAAAMGTHL